MWVGNLESVLFENCTKIASLFGANPPGGGSVCYCNPGSSGAQGVVRQNLLRPVLKVIATPKLARSVKVQVYMERGLTKKRSVPENNTLTVLPV